MGLVQMIPGHPGHLPRDSGTERVDGETVDLGVRDWTMPPTRPRWLTPAPWAWAAAVAATILAFLNAVLAVLGRSLDWWPVPIALGFAWMGCVLLARRPGHPMGPLLCLIGFVNAISGFVFAYARYALVHPGQLPFATTALWANTWLSAPAASLTGLVLPLVFPEGRLLSPRWRPALWTALAFIPLWVAGYAFIPQSMGSWFDDRPNPYTYPPFDRFFEVLQFLAVACGLAAAAAAAATVVLRWRRAGWVGRQQLKWFLAVLPIAAVSLIAGFFASGGLVNVVFGALAGILLPVAIGIAVLRYRLYEIDVLLSRAVLYGLLTIGVAAVYLAVVAVCHIWFGMSSDLPLQVVATAVAAAALFPLRDRVQRRVDRLFYGDRGRPYEALARLGRLVEESSGTESALDSVVKTIADSLRLPYVALELRVGDGWRQAAVCSHGLPSDVTQFPLISQRETVGRLVVSTRSRSERLSPDDERLLADLARQAGPATHAVALRQALDASRAGLVTAREEERRRLRRDLHDGLGPTLAGLTLGLDTARARSAEQPELQELLGRLKAETQRAVSDVRRIVYGLRPPALDQFGLAGSLREEVGRLQYEAPSLTVTLDAPDEGLANLPAAVEVACYRIVTEALTNVTRHAQATQCSVRIRLDHDLDVDVRDDGVGLPEGWRTGVGIASMRERVAELGGRLAIEPCLPHGTRITACLPTREQP
jgi:two-component system, NarL family, sensor kinase